MAIGWLSVLQAVPWSDVIINAPKVAEGAKKLWSTVSKKPVDAPTASQAPTASSSSMLDARVTALEANAAQLHEQLVASSELIKALAEQNTQLIQGIEANRLKVKWLAGLALVGAVTGMVSVGLLLAHG
ncbi:hypothetical protein [Aquabacterium sp. CECT 9606]|uniref:hypothetical protein n=1 Tax=Aquabacterium sp. CECT 9606 TaxID=2845822 RepID=UPI001E438734|nr:hypothetical protein [Aquabacterium sp. CECT 9606]CAH0351959.1 hypothetical protein AQB9606_02532 [Aquabacterium sp. CECT 9606]